MSQKPHVAQLMREVGPALSEVQVTEFADDDVWTVVFTDETIVFLDWAEADASLVATVDVGSPPEAEQARIYALLLQYNSQWRRLGALRAAIDEPGGTVSLIYSLPAVDLALPTLCDVIQNMRSLAQAWSKIVADPNVEPTQWPGDAGLAGTDDFLRV